MTIAQDDWVPFDLVGPTPATEEVKAEPVITHRPRMKYRDITAVGLLKPVPDQWREHLIAAQPDDYDVPFWYTDGFMVAHHSGTYPGSPAVEPGSKVLTLDDWGNPRAITVVGMEGGHVVGMFGMVPIVSDAWLALDENAPLSDGPGVRTDLLTAEESEALEAELAQWSKFLGVRAEKFGWCGTFENILEDVGVKPWRPGFKTVTLQVYTTIKGDLFKDAIFERIGGEADPQEATVTALVTLKDIDRETYNNNRWRPLLEAKGYTNLTDVYVHSKEVEDL